MGANLLSKTSPIMLWENETLVLKDTLRRYVYGMCVYECVLLCFPLKTFETTNAKCCLPDTIHPE